MASSDPSWSFFFFFPFDAGLCLDSVSVVPVYKDTSRPLVEHAHSAATTTN